MLERVEVDHLTGFLSRELLDKFLQENMIEAASERKSLFITLLDLDHFKKYNDRFGHIFGDDILRYASEVMRSTFGETSNYFFRYGGDEFVVVSIDKKVADIVRAIRRYNSRVYYRPSGEGNRSYRITFSAGIAIFPQDAQTVGDLLKKADKAMYFSKKHGRKTVTLASNIVYRLLADIITLAMVAAASAYFTGYLFYNNPYIVRDTAASLLYEMKRVKASKSVRAVVVPKKKAADLDVVTLKSGVVREGHILVNSAKEIIIKIHSPGGELIVSIPAENIETIKYADTAAVKKN